MLCVGPPTHGNIVKTIRNAHSTLPLGTTATACPLSALDPRPGLFKNHMFGLIEVSLKPNLGSR